jgi:hypothetical protein
LQQHHHHPNANDDHRTCFRRKERPILSFCFSFFSRRRRGIQESGGDQNIYLKIIFNLKICPVCGSSEYSQRLANAPIQADFVYGGQTVAIQGVSEIASSTSK